MQAARKDHVAEPIEHLAALARQVGVGVDERERGLQVRLGILVGKQARARDPARSR